MTDRRILPASQTQLVDREGRATPPFYDFMRRIVGAASASSSSSADLPPGLLGASFITATNEASALPGSRRLAAGANITLDDSIDGQLRISATSIASSSDGYPAQLGYAGI